MLTAMNGDGERVNASDAKRFCNKGDYYCPRCEKPVYTKKGRIVIDHFSHYPGTFAECETWEPESETHLLMKDTARDLFATPYVNIRVEERVGNLWPDLLITLGNGERIAVECQHSRITEGAIKRRTNKLKKHVDYVVWIYSTSNFSRRDGEFSFDEDSRHMEFNNGHPDSVYLGDGSYIVLSKGIRDELDMSLEDSILDCSRDSDRYWRIVEEYERKEWEGMKKELEEAEERMRNDEIDELFGVNKVALEIGKTLETWKGGLAIQFDQSRGQKTIDQSHRVVSPNWFCRKLRKRFSWLYGRLIRRNRLILTLTGAQEELLNSRIRAARELGFKLSKYKPGLLYKKILIGAIFLDFRRISKNRLRPSFYITKEMSPQSLQSVIQELSSNSPIYRVIGLDVEREIKKLLRRIEFESSRS